MPNPGLCRMFWPWPQAALVRTFVIRHSLTPPERPFFWDGTTTTRFAERTARPVSRVCKRLHHAHPGTGLLGHFRSNPSSTDPQIWPVAPEEAWRNLCTGRGSGAEILAVSPERMLRTAWRCCCAVPVSPPASRPGSYAAEETASVSPTTTHYELRAIPIRRTRSDAGQRSELCALHRSVPVCTIPANSHTSFSPSCFGCDGVRSRPGSQAQSWARAAPRECPSIFSSLSTTPRKNHGGSGHLCAYGCPLVVCDLAQVPFPWHGANSAAAQRLPDSRWKTELCDFAAVSQTGPARL